MKIEFYDKETGEAKQFQEHYVLDADSYVHRVIQRGHGEYLELDHSVGWRIIDQWQPIETAPKDGIILVLRKHRFYPTIATWDPKVGLFENDYGVHIHDATHWMSLPQTPQSSESNPQS